MKRAPYLAAVSAHPSPHIIFTLFMISIWVFCVCSPAPTSLPEDLNESTSLGGGDNNANVLNQSLGTEVGVLLNMTEILDVSCSVAFISPQYAITAAHCVNINVPFSNYKVVTNTPATISDPGHAIEAIFVHPLWSGNIQIAEQHIQQLQTAQTSPLENTSWYDIAVIRLILPKSNEQAFTLGGLPQGGLFGVTSISFSSGLNGLERISEMLSVSRANSTTFTILSPSTVSKTGGGGGAIISTPQNGGILVGIFSGGVQNVGALFTRVDAHQRFVTDVMMGQIGGDYSILAGGDIGGGMIDGGREGNPNNPGPDRVDPTFDCTQESDQFCDVVCLGDVDCEMMMTEDPTGSPIGYPCTGGEDCQSRLCLNISETRSICSEYCSPSQSDSCPPELECRMTTMNMYVCGPREETNNGGPVEELLYFGADCTNDAQCTTRTCIDHGGRQWCSQRCMMDSDCPVSYVCTDVGTTRACTAP